MLKPSKEIKSEAGSLAVFPGRTYALTFPGYTGDAQTHHSFIRAAQNRGLGVICVTPVWSNSVDDMTSKSQTLLRSVIELNLPVSYLRGVSFGAALGLTWINQVPNLIAIALITPCSAEQLPDAAVKLGMSVKGPSKKPDDIAFDGKVRIISIADDSVVPAVDPYFENLGKLVEKQIVQYGDHFTAGELKECSEDVVTWFLEDQQ